MKKNRVCTAPPRGPPVAVANVTAGYLLPWLHELVAGRHDTHPRTPNNGRLGYPDGSQQADLPQAGRQARLSEQTDKRIQAKKKGRGGYTWNWRIGGNNDKGPLEGTMRRHGRVNLAQVRINW